MPLSDVVDNAANAVPEQTGATALKVGITCGMTTISIVAVKAHKPVVGVNV